jgi:hypothetical protein
MMEFCDLDFFILKNQLPNMGSCLITATLSRKTPFHFLSMTDDAKFGLQSVFSHLLGLSKSMVISDINEGRSTIALDLIHQVNDIRIFALSQENDIGHGL